MSIITEGYGDGEIILRGLGEVGITLEVHDANHVLISDVTTLGVVTEIAVVPALFAGGISHWIELPKQVFKHRATVNFVPEAKAKVVFDAAVETKRQKASADCVVTFLAEVSLESQYSVETVFSQRVHATTLHDAAPEPDIHVVDSVAFASFFVDQKISREFAYEDMAEMKTRILADDWFESPLSRDEEEIILAILKAA